MANFDEVEIAINYAKGIAWDTCHKIYLLMDNEQVEKMRGYGYGDENDPDSLITREQMTADEMLETVKKWYDDSCSLRFVQSVETNLEDPNEGFISLIGQFEDEDCEDCGESGCQGVCNDYDDEEDDEEDED
jgi:hypothetical protein